MIVIFWDKHDILLNEYLPRGTTINGLYCASIIEWPHCAILEKRGGKRLVLLHANAPIHTCNIVQTAIRKPGFVELNHPGYSLDIASCDYYLSSDLKKFPRGKNFSRDDETIDTVEDYLNKLD